MAFNNRIRLPFQILRPQFKAERNVFRKADGSFKTMSAIIQKSMEGETDWLPEKIHERLNIAFNHDTVNIEGDKYLGGISPDGDYDIEWSDFLDYPIAKAKFKVNVQPFAASNHNCQTCEEATQLDLTNDIFVDAYDENLTLEEEGTYEINVATNDQICCYPAVISIISFDTTYLSSATITQAGLLTIVLKAGLVDANGVPLVTYRVTCPNGGYDEAIVYGDINGSTAGCLIPESVAVLVTGTTTAEATWEAPSPAPVNGYIWQLFESQNPGSPVQSGTTAGLIVNLTGLTPGTDYRFDVKSDCDTVESIYVEVEFSTLVETETCGEYDLVFNDPGGDPAVFADATYLNCDSTYVTVRIFHTQTATVCARQSSAGAPDSIESTLLIEINYQGLC